MSRINFLCLVSMMASSAGTVDGGLVLNAPMPITHRITVNPIIVSNDGGGDTANFFGSAGQETEIKGFIDDIWAQAGLDVAWLSPRALNSTETLDGSDGPNGNSPRPTTDLSGDAGGIDHETIGNNAGVTVRDGMTINMFFVNIVAGFSVLSANSSAALSETPTVGGLGDDTSAYVGTNLLGFGAGREIIGSVIAHEIGHNLSLPNLDVPEGLMRPGGSALADGQRLNGAQISDALASSGLVAIPEPGSAGLLIMVLGGSLLIRQTSTLLAFGKRPQNC